MEPQKWVFDPLQPHSFDIICADPPWHFKVRNEKTGIKKSAQAHYSVMSVDDIAALPVHELAARDAVLLLWVPAPLLPSGIACMKHWGFVYRTNLVWRKVTKNGKNRWGPGFWARTLHEQVLLGTVGDPFRKLCQKAFPSLFDGVAREHSRKPSEFYDLVDQCLDGRKVDLFARESRPGWETWGLERTKYDEGDIATGGLDCAAATVAG